MIDAFNNVIGIIAGILGLAAVGYLVVALVKPERF